MQTIRLTYVRENYPYIAGCSVRSGVLTACQEPGITSEIWLQFARQYNYTLELVKTANYGAFAEVNGTRLWTGVIGLLVNGSADASLSLLSPNEYRYSDVIFGPVLTTYELGFIYGLPLESQNIVVSVYDQLSIQVLLLIICFCAAVYSVNRGVLEGFWAVVAALSFQNDWWVRLFNPLLIFGFLFINWMYFAGYRSQAIASSWSDRPFANVEEEARSKLASGKLKLIVEDSTLLYNAKMVYGNDGVFERNPPIVERNLEAIGQLLCTDATIVYYGNVAPMGSVWFAKTPCPIKRQVI
uniref:Solute-binding protein family 3/N-terminal domain-containing protein n=1 Tax=Plectus sambesii TaxID=2011161 RepID=A0A914WW05_9BILA